MTTVPTLTPSPTLEPTVTPLPEFATSIVDLVGVWEHRMPKASEYMKINEGGTVISARGVPENLDEQPHSTSEIWFEGNQFMIKVIDSVIPGFQRCIDDIGIYEVQMMDNESLQLVLIKDTCEKRGEKILVGEWVPVQ
jgi:hypothetical protein